ncbi:50S ribosomal protein L11 methyltransferase [Mangrovicella endophytica]|uniref:50S ribosomal protein L11 methyltransferase n=1 Tax=Mangrovicella endophytica TaxID=2066697 RepID=UPI003CC9994D
MTQTRYFRRGSQAEAQRLFSVLESAFEDEGAPIAITEIDEAADVHEVSIYLDTREGDRRHEVEAVLGDAAVGLEQEQLPDIDWMAQVLAELKPVRAGRFLVHGSHDRGEVAPGDLSIEIEAGQAFGTGHHGTTAGCLEMIEMLVSRRRIGKALDLGTGSAVLAIGIAKLGGIPVLATDIDPVAVEVAQGNVVLNGVADLVETAVATGFDAPAIQAAEPFDLIVANILAGPLIDLAPAFGDHLAEGGDIVLSGILTTQRDGVLAAFDAAGLIHRETFTRGEWVTLHLTR